MKLKAINDLKESIINKPKNEMIQKGIDEKGEYYKRQEKKEERFKLVKEDKEKEKLIKLNKLYIFENNLRIRHMRDENDKKQLMKEKENELKKEKKRRNN